jgi:hypothetical protein
MKEEESHPENFDRLVTRKSISMRRLQNMEHDVSRQALNMQCVHTHTYSQEYASQNMLLSENGKLTEGEMPR